MPNSSFRRRGAHVVDAATERPCDRASSIGSAWNSGGGKRILISPKAGMHGRRVRRTPSSSRRRPGSMDDALGVSIQFAGVSDRCVDCRHCGWRVAARRSWRFRCGVTESYVISAVTALGLVPRGAYLHLQPWHAFRERRPWIPAFGGMTLPMDPDLRRDDVHHSRFSEKNGSVIHSSARCPPLRNDTRSSRSADPSTAAVPHRIAAKPRVSSTNTNGGA